MYLPTSSCIFICCYKWFNMDMEGNLPNIPMFYDSLGSGNYQWQLTQRERVEESN